jgi:YesN/AraC family two-component response regulator
MFECLCGKSFENEISCSRHKSSCIVYREFKRNQNNKSSAFLIEDVDHVVCKICNYKARDLSRHLTEARAPHPSLEEYRKLFPDQKIVCSEVNEKRKQTCIKLHGNPNYRNFEAQRQGAIEAFASDPTIMERIRNTKFKKYGDPTYVNAEKRKQTLLKKYGVDNPMKNPEIKKRAMHTYKVLYGDNPIQRDPAISKQILMEMHYTQNLSLQQIGNQLGFSPEKVAYWMKKYELKVNKKIVVPKFKEFISPTETVKEYFALCLQNGRVLSFSETGKFLGNKKNQRLKRLFNAGRPYQHLKEELKLVALSPELWPEFLAQIEKDSSV